MAETLDTLGIKLDKVLAKVTEVLTLTRTTPQETLNMITNLDVLQAAADQLNTATSQEAALLQALSATINSEDAKLDLVQARLDQLIADANPAIPQSVLDELAAINATVSGVS